MTELLPASQLELRASDADRDRAAAVLGGAMATGRLTSAEYAERLDAAYAAKTLGDLAPLTRDLPADQATGATAGAQAELVAAAPDRVFRPPYVGGRGWLGVRLDGEVDWDEIAELCQDAYRAVAPARLVALLGS